MRVPELTDLLRESSCYFVDRFTIENVKRTAHRRTKLPEAAFGLKAHCGWAALVVLATCGGELQVIDRRRLELVAEADKDWAKQPYHAAEELQPAEAEQLVKRSITAAKRMALRGLRSTLKRTREYGLETRRCGLLVGEPMPSWSVAEILAVHFRMHKAEGVLFRDVLAEAAEACDLKLVAIPEKLLTEHAERAFTTTASPLAQKIAALGKSVGAPWGRDQKDAALAALIALQGT